jgi:hypothetical protein
MKLNHNAGLVVAAFGASAVLAVAVVSALVL